ncbi:ComEA family DNA-binding protein [Streptomyces cyanogenus]|uniref:ComEA family DNA-binding protein n=1 Tax=Streptomyces cyanogenus TaxID=80860 RepID=UPI001AA0E4D2|nr:ComEA family DNA-binding protein [Streptomyces cyanogenus]
MALRSRPRTATPTSGPGRGAASDGRLRHRRATTHPRRARHRPPAPADELRRRAELLFGERAVQWRESGNAPPDPQEPASTPTATTTGPAPSLSTKRQATTALPARGTTPGGTATVSAPEPATIPARARTTAAREPATAPAAEPAGAVSATSVPGSATEPEPADAVRLSEPEAAGPAWRERAGLALRERMPVWLQARYGVERRGVVALAVVLVAAAVFAVQHFWAGRPQSVSAPQVVHAPAPFTRKNEGATAGAAVSTPATPGAEIVVDVSGKVRKPGIRRLPAGARVADALRAAGGVRPGVGTEGLNRARFLVDGEQIVVGEPAGAAAPPGPAAGPLSGSTGTGPAAPVSLSTATVDQLDTLPGVGPVLAQHIIDYRSRHGGFRSVDELREVNGIGDRRFTDLRELVRP